MMKRIWKFLAFLIIGALLVTVISLAAFGNRALAEEPRTWYVDDDLQDCPDADFTRIQDAVNAARPEDTIIVCPGTYTENVYVNKSLTIKSENGAETTIVQAANSDNHVFEIAADYVTISGFTVKGATGTFAAAIYVVGQGHCLIENNIISNNYYAIELYSSNNTIIANNLINGSYIWLSSSASNTVSDNELNDSYIDLFNSSNNLISGNVISRKTLWGIKVAFSSSNTISNNTIKVGGIKLGTSGQSSGNLISNNTFEGCGLEVNSAGNTVENCTVNGKPLIYLENESGLEIVAADAGQIILVRCQNMVVRDCYLSNTSVGINFYETSDSLVESITLESNGTGIYLNGSTDNIIRNNICNGNGHAITIGSSSNNRIQDNNIRSNYLGIYLYSDSSQHNMVQDNNIYGYGNYIGIYLASASHNVIQNNSIYDYDYGIWVTYSTVRNNKPVPAKNNNILRNNISNNTEYGIFLSYSLDNNIYFNNFNNANNSYSSSKSTDIWNSPDKITYTCDSNTYTNYLGNYWSDYTGIDANGDCIGDTPYIIDSDQDNYPLMKPFEDYLQYGDVSRNGTISAYDASLILQYLVGSITLTLEQQEVADVSDNGTISAYDAALILQYSVGLITKFPVETIDAPFLNPKTENKLMAEAIEQLKTVSFDKEQQQVLEQLKHLLTQKLMPVYTTLLQNYPNPFNLETWFPYQLAEAVEVTIKIYTSKGELLQVLHLGQKPAGYYLSKERAAYWDGRNNIGEHVASGMYFYTLHAEEFKATRKMLIIK